MASRKSPPVLINSHGREGACLPSTESSRSWRQNQLTLLSRPFLGSFQQWSLPAGSITSKGRSVHDPRARAARLADLQSPEAGFAQLHRRRPVSLPEVLLALFHWKLAGLLRHGKPLRCGASKSAPQSPWQRLQTEPACPPHGTCPATRQPYRQLQKARSQVRWAIRALRLASALRYRHWQKQWPHLPAPHHAQNAHRKARTMPTSAGAGKTSVDAKPGEKSVAAAKG